MKLQLSRPTVSNYIKLLEMVFLLGRLHPWHSNRQRRLVKTPKIHIADTGLACALLRVDATGLMADRSLLGRLLETFVFHELRRQASWHDDLLSFYHYRDRDGAEVDIVIERGTNGSGGRGGQGVRNRFPQPAQAQKNGEASVRFGDGLYAVPIRRLWENP